MKIFDTHAHYDDRRFDEYEIERHTLLKNLFENEVELILGAGCDIESSKANIALAERYKGFYTAVGFHPGNCLDESLLDESMNELSRLLEHEKAVAVGEIGLDYYWDDYPSRDCQKKWFERQLELAKEKDLPVVIHDREAHGDTMEILLAHKGVRGVLHSFSGSAEMAKELVKRDFYISFSGVITFKNARQSVEAAAVVPIDRILIETDAPYLAPVPYRGKTNHSGYAVKTCEKLAEIFGKDPEEMAAITLENGKRLYKIK